MRVIIQRVTNASVVIDGNHYSGIKRGLLVFAGFEDSDSGTDINYISTKLVNLRIFDDENGVMNLSVKDISGEILIVSQFTLHAQTRKGNRPSYIKAARPEISIPLYENFINNVTLLLGKSVQTGIFGADMKISLINDGPVTIWMDSKE